MCFILFFCFLFQEHLGMCKKLPVECPDGCGTIVMREKVKDIIESDLNCLQILSSRRAIKSPTYGHLEQKPKSQKRMICSYLIHYLNYLLSFRFQTIQVRTVHWQKYFAHILRWVVTKRYSICACDIFNEVASHFFLNLLFFK